MKEIEEMLVEVIQLMDIAPLDDREEEIIGTLGLILDGVKAAIASDGVLTEISTEPPYDATCGGCRYFADFRGHGSAPSRCLAEPKWYPRESVDLCCRFWSQKESS